MAKKQQLLYGPVPSRRLGLSLGIDIVPSKVCTLDCIYCQVARTTNLTTQRKPYIPASLIIDQLTERLQEPLQADFITLAGSGEPTLNSELPQIITAIKQITKIPVALLTNGTLFHLPNVRAECLNTDVVMPSLDAADDVTFSRINRTHPDISIKMLIDGLIAFRSEFKGKIWLEIFLIEGINTDPSQIEKLKNAVEKIEPEKIHLNTAVRPTVDPGVRKLSPERIRTIAAQFGPNAEVIADFHNHHTHTISIPGPKDVLSMLKRRPCTLKDISSGLSITKEQAQEHISRLKQKKLIRTQKKDSQTFFHAN
jgi:wyosine [tRNA(Phe)-imidazoG37] synthetase (radical SAM superfamily)